MGAGHTHALYVHEHSPIHYLAPEAKLAATVLFVVIVAVTPREALWAFAGYSSLLLALFAAARIPIGFVATRLTAVFPFVLFALLIPFVASGEQVEVLGLSLSREGLWGAWNILAKATLGAGSMILLAATTEVPDMLKGMARLKVPVLVTGIAGFMIRYLEVIAGELSRMRTAMAARGYSPRWVWQARPIASSAGALFIRSYERGERVHSAMLARGFTGTMPELDEASTPMLNWAKALLLPLAAAVVLALALVLR